MERKHLGFTTLNRGCNGLQHAPTLRWLYLHHVAQSLEDKKKEPKGEEKNWTGVSSIWEFQAASAVSRYRTFQIKPGVSHEPRVM